MLWEYLAPPYPVLRGQIAISQRTLQFGGGGLGGGAGKVQDSHTFPGFGSITSLEIRIKAILTILELKAPPKAQ